MTGSNKWYIIPLALVATFLWGSAFAGAKIGFEYLPPIMLSGFRFTLAGIILIPICLIMKVNWKEELKHWRFILLFSFVQTFMQYGLFYSGLNMTPGAVAAIINGAGPLFIAIMSHITLKDDKLTPRKVVSIVLGLCGVIFISISGKVFSLGSSNFTLGVILLILSCMVGSYTNIMVVKNGKGISSVMLTMVANFVGGIALFIFSLFVEGPSYLNTELPFEFYLALLWLAIIPAAGFSIWYYLLTLPGVKVSEINMWKFTIPVIGVLLSWWLLPDEEPCWETVVGILIIVSSLIILQIDPKKLVVKRAAANKLTHN